MKATVVTVTTSPTLVIPADNKNRSCRLHNKSGGSVYIGHEGLSTSSGFLIDNGENIEVFVPLNEALWGIVSSGTSDIMTLTPDTD